MRYATVKPYGFPYSSALSGEVEAIACWPLAPKEGRGQRISAPNLGLWCDMSPLTVSTHYWLEPITKAEYETFVEMDLFTVLDTSDRIGTVHEIHQAQNDPA